MARRKTLTDNMILKLKPEAKRVTMPDPEMRGHYVRITPKGAKSYVAVARDRDGKQRWATIGSADHLTIAEARKMARAAMKRINRINASQPTVEPPPTKPDSFKAVAENYLKRHVKAKGLRSQSEIERILETQVYPVWKDREFTSIRRGDVAALLDKLQDALERLVTFRLRRPGSRITHPNRTTLKAPVSHEAGASHLWNYSCKESRYAIQCKIPQQPIRGINRALPPWPSKVPIMLQ